MEIRIFYRRYSWLILFTIYVAWWTRLLFHKQYITTNCLYNVVTAMPGYFLMKLLIWIIPLDIIVHNGHLFLPTQRKHNLKCGTLLLYWVNWYSASHSFNHFMAVIKTYSCIFSYHGILIGTAELKQSLQCGIIHSCAVVNEPNNYFAIVKPLFKICF